MQDRVNEDIALIYKWSIANGLTLNVKKTKCMLVTTKTREKIEIKLGNSLIEEVESFKYLGIIIQNNLKFNLYIAELTSKISSAAGVLYALRDFLPGKSLKNLYYSLIYPQLSLHILAWGNSPETVLQPLKVALNRAIRSLSFNRVGERERTTDLYNRHDILNIDKLYKFKICQFMFREHNEQSCMFFNVRDEFRWAHSHDTRRLRPYRLPCNRLELTNAYFLNDALILWARIPESVKNVQTIKSFKSKVRKLIMIGEI